MPPPLLTLQDIHLTFGGTPLLEGAGLQVGERDRLCLVGRNGSGKSTLLKIAAGLVEADSGERFVKPGVAWAYLEQEPDFSGFATALDYVEAGLSETDEPYRAQMLLLEMGLTGAEDPSTLSGGEGRRVAIARVLAPEPDILLLDEPTNHLDLPTIDWLEKTLAPMSSALVLISHDRRFLSTLTKRTVWLDRGGARTLDRGFADFEAWRDKVLEEEELERHKLDRKIVREEHWVRYGVTARRKRNVRRMKELQALRATRRDARVLKNAAKMTAAEGGATGKRVIEAMGISKAYDGRAVVKDFSIKIARGDRVGLAGPNGAGKTTLLNMLTGLLAPDTGEVFVGQTVEMVSLDQRRASLKDDMTVKDVLTEGKGDMVAVGGAQTHVMTYMKDFLFSSEQARSPVSALSGGERGRLALAVALAKPSNLLVLDEPTNDLDLETLDLLEEMLADYKGTVLLVSHDRDFLDRIVTSTIAPDETRPGAWIEYAGGYSDMLAQKGEAAAPAEAPAKKNIAPKEKPAAKPSAQKLSYKEKYALETLPDKIAALETDIAALRETLAAPDLFAKDPDGFNAAAAKLEQAEADLAAAEEEWLALEMRREEIEGSKGMGPL